MNQVSALTADVPRRPSTPVPSDVRPPMKAPAPVALPANPSEAYLDTILRAARDPSVDIGKMRELMQMRKELLAEEAQNAFIRAKIAMRPNLPKVEKTGQIIITEKGTNRVIQSTAFAKFEDIHDAAFPVLIAHGFDLDFRTGTRDGRVVVTAVLSHQGGHREETTLDGPLDTSGSKNNVQGVGSTLSYLKRYTMCALLNIRTSDKGEFDDDGLKSGGASLITDDQVTELRELLTETGASYDRFLKVAKVEALDQIQSSAFAGLCEQVRSVAARRGGK